MLLKILGIGRFSMPSARTVFGYKYNISSAQRNAASLFWGQLLRGERTAPVPEIPLQHNIQEMLLQNDPQRISEFERELNTRIFDHRHEPLKLESTLLPEGVLLEAANQTKIPLGALPNHVTMTFPDNNNLRINDEEFAASQILAEKPKPTVTLSSKNLFYPLASRLANTLSTRSSENKSAKDDSCKYTL